MKFFKLFVGSIMFFNLFSCSSTKFKSQETSLKLKGNPTTGYNWYYTFSDNSIVNIEENVVYQGEKGMVGASSLFIYIISSKKPGSTKLRFEYKREWENVPANIIRTYNIEVNDKGEINMTEDKNPAAIMSIADPVDAVNKPVRN